MVTILTYVDGMDWNVKFSYIIEKFDVNKYIYTTFVLCFSKIEILKSKFNKRVCFVDRCLSFCTFSFGHCVVYSFSTYGFWLPIWYLQTLLNTVHMNTSRRGRVYSHTCNMNKSIGMYVRISDVYYLFALTFKPSFSKPETQ